MTSGLTSLRSALRRRHQGPWRSFLLLVAAAVVLPAITATEQITFSIAGIDLNVRVAAYFCVAAAAGISATAIVVRMERRPAWLMIMLATLSWFTFTALVAHQSPVEWLPTIVRLGLYFSAAVICYSLARSIQDSGQVGRLSRLLPLALMSAAVIPAVAGIAEFIRGTAPIVNGAPRVSGSMPTHPVAYSLVLVICALVIMGPAMLRGRSPGGIARWVAIAVLAALVFTTFTRLSVVLLVGSGVAVAALMPATRPLRTARVAAAIVVGGAVVLLAQPLFEARFTYPAPLSGVISRTGPSPSKEASPSPDISPVPRATQTVSPTESPSTGWDIEVDGSIAYRILLTRRGLEYLARSPVVGQGPGSFDRLFEADSGRARVAAHNDLLSVAVETGLPGLGLYLLTLAAIAWALRPRRPSGVLEADALIVTALVALAAINIGAAIHNPTYFVEIQLPIWILVGTALGLRDRATATGPHRTGPNS